MNFVLVTPARRLSGQTAPATLAGPTVPCSAKPQTPAGSGQQQDVFKSSPEEKPYGLNGLDRRWSQRVGVGKAGWIGAANLESPVRCKVCNTSKHGALLELEHADALGRVADKPLSTLTLVWLNNRIRSEANCTVRWRNRAFLGVSFIGPVRTSVERRG